MRMRAEIKFVNCFLEELEKRNIGYCILRNVEEIENGDAHDIDMSYDISEAEEIQNALSTIATEMGWKLHLKTGDFRDVNNIKCFHYYKECSQGEIKIVHFDFFPNFEWNGYILLENEQLLKGVITDTIYHKASLTVEAITKLFIRLLYNGKVKGKYKDFVYAVFIEHTEEVTQVLESFLDVDSYGVVIACVREKAWDVLEKNREKIITAISKKCRRIVVSKKRYLMKKYMERPGMIVAFEGTDGSGKSTIIDGLNSVLDNTFPDGMRHYYHWRPGVVIKKKKTNSDTVSDPHAKKAYGKLISFAKFMLFNVDYIFGYLLKVRTQLGKGHLVVFDRYYYDYYMDKIRYRLNLPDGIILAFMKLIPAPDVIFVLKGDPEVLYARKKEISIDEIRYQMNRLQQLMPHVKNSVEIDVNQPVDVVINNVAKEILDYGHKRYV